jgi:hypothetical protein
VRADRQLTREDEKERMVGGKRRSHWEFDPRAAQLDAVSGPPRGYWSTAASIHPSR